jgi:homoserine O-acetyltransferase
MRASQARCRRSGLEARGEAHARPPPRLDRLAFFVLATPPAFAHTPAQPPHQLYKMGDLKLESGEVIKDFAISYVTHGTLNAKKSNAILMVTAIGGNHHRLDFMIGPGKALDTDKYFIIATDAISNGFTTSPSNSTG